MFVIGASSTPAIASSVASSAAPCPSLKPVLTTFLSTLLLILWVALSIPLLAIRDSFSVTLPAPAYPAAAPAPLKRSSVPTSLTDCMAAYISASSAEIMPFLTSLFSELRLLPYVLDAIPTSEAGPSVISMPIPISELYASAPTLLIPDRPFIPSRTCLSPAFWIALAFDS